MSANANLSDIINIENQLHLVSNMTLYKRYPDLYKYRMRFYTVPTPLMYTIIRKKPLDRVIYKRPDESLESDVLDKYGLTKKSVTLGSKSPYIRDQRFDNDTTTTQIQKPYDTGPITSTTATRYTTKDSTRKASETDTTTTTGAAATRAEGTVVETVARVTTVVTATSTVGIILAATPTMKATGTYTGKTTKTAKSIVTKKLNVTALAKTKKISKEDRKAKKKEEEKKKLEKKLEEAKNRTTTEKYSDRKRKPITV